MTKRVLHNVSEDHGFIFKKKKTKETTVLEKKPQQRRSSLGLRGKRITENSNFCGNFPSKSIVPHPSLDPCQYYRHIDAQSSDPLRMRQLVLWCGQKLLSSQENLKKVQSNLLENISKSLVNFSWYHRPVIPQVKKTVCHPGNLSNAKQLQEFENAIVRLENELRIWQNIKDSYSTKHCNEMTNLVNNDLKKMVLAQEPLQEPPKYQHVSETVKTNLDEIRREVYHFESIMHKISVLESKTKKSCESLFSMMLKAYSEREKNKTVDAIDMLKLLSTSQ